ncbi:uncharacterized protein LOC111244072 isoform X2 [Varroa destructor]|nr:uncharacterized protein LOC111244072 isoform X2 [Varroa destructor]XP_022646404.1 uncharacterized protein LOC111244072 isoform X2 [Varroa destructor]
MLAWDHLKLLFDEIKEAKKLTPQHMQEFSTLSTEFPYAVLLLAEGSISKPSKTGLPYVILEAGNIIEIFCRKTMFLRDSILPVWVVFAVIALRKSTSAAQKQALLPDKISTLLDTFLKVPPALLSQLSEVLAEDLKYKHSHQPTIPDDLAEDLEGHIRLSTTASKPTSQDIVKYLDQEPAHYNILELPGLVLLKFLAGKKSTSLRHRKSQILDEYSGLFGDHEIQEDKDEGVITVDREAIVRALFALIGVSLFTSLLLVILISCTGATTKCRHPKKGNSRF